MALLSQTQGTADRLWSLLQVLVAHGGTISREQLSDWLNPLFTFDGKESDEDSAFRQTVGAASGLELIESDANDVTLSQKFAEQIPRSYNKFPDFIHKILINIDDKHSDSLLFRVFACVVVESANQKTATWMYNMRNKDFADYINEKLMADEAVNSERAFNDTKLPHWRRWMDFLGLQVPLPNGEYYPFVFNRLDREVISQLPEEEIHVDDFLKLISREMPYLDGGDIFMSTAENMRVRIQPKQASPVLSAALRELEGVGRVALVSKGDASGNLYLSQDAFGQSASVTYVRVNAKGGNND